MKQKLISPSHFELIAKGILARQKSKTVQRGSCGVIYTRVSSKEQAENNGSLESQLKQCKEYAMRKGIVVKQYFGGVYESAKTDGRKEFQGMLTYVRKQKDVAYIIVWNYERFSRTGDGAIHLSKSLRKEGIFIKSITEELDTSTASGRMMENFHHIKNHWDNDAKSERTKIMTREVMLKGYWPYMTPLGYKNLNPKHRACNHQYVITEEGKLLKKAFQWKANGEMTNKEIVGKLSLRGLRLTEKNFRWIISNVFYAGYVTGNLVEHQLIKGHHPPLIDLKTYLKANALLQEASNVGIPKCPIQEDLPLKVFARDETSGSPLTGYSKKGNWYYKAREKGVGVNINADVLNGMFKELLEQFQYNKQHYKTLKAAITRNIKEKLQDQIDDTIRLKKRKTELKTELDKIEERFIKGEIKEHLFEKWEAKYSSEIEKITEELEKKSFDCSNLENTVEKCLSIAENLSQTWLSMKFAEKQRLQYLIFPEGVMYSKEKGVVRTERVNLLFAEIPPQKRLLEEKKKGNSEKNCLKSYPVPRTGLFHDPIRPRVG